MRSKPRDDNAIDPLPSNVPEDSAATVMEVNTPRLLLIVATFGLATAFATRMCAQQTPSTNPAASLGPQDLAKSVHNPFEHFIKIPLLSTTGFSIGPHHNVGASFNLQPLLPFSLNREWDLLARPSLSLEYQPSPHEQFGMTDMQSSFFLSPRNASEWIWGIGPIFQFPAATSPRLGTGR